ncbi:TetR/AcrR family transcriptional regulator [Amorphus coralli]|uniref:TetR/AcrR family transcriptional regulator n=1 Tax=Amorphus coralli TaxID=340680 RepID=UPI0003732D0A|nr:TetR/AcrR family transcriptional regulator [Amorphus coralli]
MAQIKKQAVAEAILEAATTLFRERGYSRTSMAEIARTAHTSTSNIYVYFYSKLDILFAIYEPWLEERLVGLEEEIEALPTHRERLVRVLDMFWRELPTADNGFANNVMQALSTAMPDEPYDRTLLDRMLERLSRMIRKSLPPHRRATCDESDLAYIVFMAFDGIAMRNQLRSGGARVDRSIQMMADLLLADPAAFTERDTSPPYLLRSS